MLITQQNYYPTFSQIRVFELVLKEERGRNKLKTPPGASVVEAHAYPSFFKSRKELGFGLPCAGEIST
jgi:hypothetical protein